MSRSVSPKKRDSRAPAAHARIPDYPVRAGLTAVTSDFEPSLSSQELSDFEYALIILMFGFQRWVENCMGAANVHGLNALDTLVLHAVNHRARGKRLAEICMVLNIDDTHLVTYALKKLATAELVLVTPQGRERHFETTVRGEKACLEYRVVRENFLVPSLAWFSGRGDTVTDTAGFLRMMTALYDQAGRFATAATAAQPKAPPVHTKR